MLLISLKFCVNRQASETEGSGSEHVVRLLDHFKHVGPHGTHVCMVFEPMGANLLSLIKHYDYHGVPIDAVRHIARQVLGPFRFPTLSEFSLRSSLTCLVSSVESRDDDSRIHC